jgi:hypothetical protein
MAMRRIRAILRVLISQKLTTILLLVAVLGPLAFLYKPGDWGPTTGSEQVPLVEPFYERAKGALVWRHFDWREVQSAAVNSGTEQALWYGWTEAFVFLPRNAAEQSQVEPGQPENLHEIVPELGRISIDESQLGVEDWRDLSHLRQLRLFEGFRLLPPWGSASEGARVAAEALSALPALKQLNLLRTGWIRLGSMPVLEILILDVTDLESVLPQDDLAAKLPRLRTLILRLPPKFQLTQEQAGVLQQISQLPQLRRVELITGLPDQRGFLTSQIETFRSYLPGLTVCRGEAGFRFSEIMVLPSIAGVLLFSQVAFSSWLWSLGCVPQTGAIPGFTTAIRQIYAMFVVLMLLSGFLSAWLLELRWYGPVCACLLAVSLVGVQQLIMQRFPGSRGQSVVTRLLPMIPFLVIIGFLVFPLTVVIPLIFGDFAACNIVMLLFSVGAFFTTLVTWKKTYACLLEQGDSATAFAGISGSENRQRATERWTAELQGTTVPSSRLLKGSFSDRLRAGSMGVTVKQIKWMLFALLCFLAMQLIMTRQFIPGALAGPLAAFLMLPIAMRTQSWNQRTQRLASEFLLPVGREDFWRHVRSAVFRDFAIGFLAVLAASIAINLYRDSFSKHLTGTLLQLVLQIGQLACVYSLAVLTFVTRKSQRRLFTLQVPMGLTMIVFYLDGLTEMAVPGATAFQPLLLPLVVLPALAGVVLLVKLPGILNKMELP